ncbi:MAG: hypothetical protein ACPHEP_01485 [Acidimicrobiales bacterium]
MFSPEPEPIDPLDAVVPAAGEKYCTNCGHKKPLTDFHKDESKDDGHRDTCKQCRSVIIEQQKKDSLDARLKEIEQEGLESLSKLSSGGSFDPHINEVFEAMMKPFGGVNGWAKHLFSTYLACDPGSQKRVKIHDMMMQLAGKVTKLGLAERQLDMMEEKDLIQVMRQHLVEYQEGNKLPSTALPTLDDKVLDVSKVEKVDE